LEAKNKADKNNNSGHDGKRLPADGKIKKPTLGLDPILMDQEVDEMNLKTPHTAKNMD